jgi:hypothetical protein
MSASFAYAGNHHGGGRHAVWCKADHLTQHLLLTQAPDRYFNPPYVGPSGWIGVFLDETTDWKDVAQRLEYSHGLATKGSGRRTTSPRTAARR